MKLIKIFSTSYEADKFSNYLRQKGILTHVSSKHSSALSKAKTGALTIAVWVVLPEQYEDVEQLMLDRSHAVSHRLEAEVIDRLVKENQISSEKSIAIWLGGLAAFLLIFFVVLVYFNW